MPGAPAVPPQGHAALGTVVVAPLRKRRRPSPPRSGDLPKEKLFTGQLHPGGEKAQEIATARYGKQVVDRTRKTFPSCRIFDTYTPEQQGPFYEEVQYQIGQEKRRA